MAYAIALFVVFAIGVLLGVLIVLRRSDYDPGVGAERVGDNLGQLGDQQQVITGTATRIEVGSGRLEARSGRLETGLGDALDTSLTMEQQIQRAREIVEGIRSRNKQNDPPTEVVADGSVD